MKDFLFILVFFSFLFYQKIVFSEDNLKNIPENSIEFSIPLSGVNLKYSKQILVDKDFFVRVALEPMLFRVESNFNDLPPNIKSDNSFDLELGLNNYLSKNNNIGTYLKSYIGTNSKLELNKFNINPYIGTGIGLNYNYYSFGVTFALDLLTTIETSNEMYIGGVLFVRPEFNIRFLF